MDIYMNKLTYNYDDDGNPVDALIGFSSGMDKESQYIYANIRLTKDDLGEGKTFDSISNKDLVAIARTKLYNFTKPTTE